MTKKWHAGVIDRDWIREFQRDSMLPEIDHGIFELRRVGVPAMTLRKSGFEANELRKGGYTESELLSVGYTLDEIYAI